MSLSSSSSSSSSASSRRLLVARRTHTSDSRRQAELALRRLYLALAPYAYTLYRPLPQPHPGHVAPQYYDVEQKSDVWKSLRPDIGGSSVAKTIGLTPYRDGNPARVYAIAVGEEQDDFKGNKYTAYGERYEPRIRAIGRAVLAVAITEYGLFRDRKRRFCGISPDGNTPALRLLGWSDASPPGLERIDWVLGKLMWEAKANYEKLKAAPIVPHILQGQFQIRVCGLHYWLLQYWHRDQTRIWLVKDSPCLWAWMRRRIDLAHQHKERRVPMTESNPYFPWLRYAGGTWRPGATCADYLSWDWFNVDPAPPKEPKTERGRASAARRGPPCKPHPPPRPMISYAHWVDILAQMRIHPGRRPSDKPGPGDPHYDGWLYWCSDVPGGEESAPQTVLDENGEEQCYDVAQMSLPPKPEIWLIYDHARVIPHDEIDLMDEPNTVMDHDPEDAAWFESVFPGIAEYAACQLEQCEWDFSRIDQDDLPERAAHLRGEGPGGSFMRRLFVERFERVPELDTPEPIDQRDQDTDEEFRESQRRMEELMIMQKYAGASHPLPKLPPSDDEVHALLARAYAPIHFQ